jgi:hypothetical protein
MFKKRTRFINSKKDVPVSRSGLFPYNENVSPKDSELSDSEDFKILFLKEMGKQRRKELILYLYLSFAVFVRVIES